MLKGWSDFKTLLAILAVFSGLTNPGQSRAKLGEIEVEIRLP